VKTWIALVSVVIGVGLLAVRVRGGEKTPAHESFGKGDCAQCHEAPPKYHGKNQWSLNHGRTELAVQQRCESCHQPSSCVACHKQPPTTHTEDFRKPATGTLGAERHVLLGRTQPASCVTCHRNLNQDCVKCHSVSEVQRWTEDGQKALAPWRHTLGED
jgi:hypothetical protein